MSDNSVFEPVVCEGTAGGTWDIYPLNTHIYNFRKNSTVIWYSKYDIMACCYSNVYSTMFNWCFNAK